MEKGTFTEIPGCKMKFELSSRKKIMRKRTSSSGKIGSHVNWYSLVRTSFILVLLFPSEIAKFGRRLERYDPMLSFRFAKQVYDLNPGAFHVVHRHFHTGR